MRDNRAGGGGVVYATLAVNVTAAAGPFQVTSPNTNVAWAPSSSQTVTWNVANTTAPPVSCANVNILLSTDGGRPSRPRFSRARRTTAREAVTIPNRHHDDGAHQGRGSTQHLLRHLQHELHHRGRPRTVGDDQRRERHHATGATLNGTVSSNGADTTVTFQYGPTVGYGSNTSAAQSPLAAGATNAAVSAAITGLTCNTLYHFRVVGSNSDGTNNGADATFTTPSCTGTPTTTTLASNNNPSTVGSSGHLHRVGHGYGADRNGHLPRQRGDHHRLQRRGRERQRRHAHGDLLDAAP